RGLDGALAARAAGGRNARSAVRGPRRRLRAAGAPAARLLRPRLGRALPRLPRDAAAGAHGQHDPGAAAALSNLGRPFTGLRRDAAAVARGAGAVALTGASRRRQWGDVPQPDEKKFHHVCRKEKSISSPSRQLHAANGGSSRHYELITNRYGANTPH